MEHTNAVKPERQPICFDEFFSFSDAEEALVPKRWSKNEDSSWGGIEEEKLLEESAADADYRNKATKYIALSDIAETLLLSFLLQSLKIRKKQETSEGQKLVIRREIWEIGLEEKKRNWI